MKRRLTDKEKEQLGYIIHYYRNAYFHDKNEGYEHYKQVDFSKQICSQAQLSRLEHGEILKDFDIYYALLSKLSLKIDKIQSKIVTEFDVYFTNILKYQNDDHLMINYNQYILAINKFQNEFRYNIIYTHYTYALEFIIYMINEEYEEAGELLEYIEGTLEVYPKTYMIVILQYIGRYYEFRQDHDQAIKYYLSSIEYMMDLNKENPVIFIDIAYTYLKQGQGLKAISYLNQCHSIFENTHNLQLLERIHKIYGMLYLKNAYYDESRQHFRSAIKYSARSNEMNKLSKNMYFMALSYYFQDNIDRTKQLINKCLEHYNFERAILLKSIIEKKRNTHIFNSTGCDLVYKLYTTPDDHDVESIYKMIKKADTIINEDLNLLIKYRMLNFYKKHKKYKKALRLVESK
ncbi:tetratricopeptide repeat protein [Haloplasma contractile]|uniref:TPR repeat domain containing protein n=1 Tax=Haloplasma contractile SSD-17B TaxID=1033810 RepID=U2EBJ0_9MOLU|nr:hypothetical protein [Haloplasma contractile]ERJ12443.1 TPR repeat domain containing protein [Haloplasma contractile SSD-17B]